jgi:plastocyanin
VTFGVPTGDPTAPAGDANPSWSGSGFISSGLVFDVNGKPYTVTFPKAGSYEYYCAIHPFMKGTVKVQTPDLGAPDNQASVDARGNALYTSAVNELKAVAASMKAKPLAVTPKAGGGKTYSISVSSSQDVQVGDVMQFFPASINISANDAIEWVSNVHTPHNVALIPPGVDPTGPPPPGLEDYDPFTSSHGVPADGKVSGPDALILSQVFGLDFPTGTTFSLTFPKAGTYKYVCILHAEQGMQGTINVGAAGAAPGAPNTGTSDPVGHDGTNGTWLIAGSLALVAASTAGAFAVARR